MNLGIVYNPFPLGGYMADDLSSVPLSTLVQEVKKRLQELDDARQSLGLIAIEGEGASAKRTKARAKSSDMSAAAFDRWAGWKKYKAENPNATPKQFFAWKRKAK
jgi:hypothetical protein